MKILITGASGFVGPYLIDELKKRVKKAQIYGTYFLHHEYDLIDNAKPYYLDLNDSNNIDALLYEIKPDWIIHLAGQSSARVSWEKPALTFKINVDGSINLLESMRKMSLKSRLLMIGSSEQYGIVSHDPINENQELKPMNPYGISKMTQERLGELYSKAFGLDILMTRSFNHIGPRQEPTFVIPDWCKQIALIEKGLKDPELSVGNLDVERDFSHVRDVVNSYIDILQNGVGGEVYNVGSGTAISLKKVLEKLTQLSGIKIDISIDKKKLRPVENKVIRCDRIKLDRVSNFKYMSIDQSLSEVLNYWRNEYQ